MPETERNAPYVLLPQRMCIDLRDNPIALATYALVARLFLLTHQSIPLSAGDLIRFDQQTSYGQARRALDRLSETGWVDVAALGRKNSYMPTWGNIAGVPRAWCFTAEKFGRPPHVRTYRISADWLDQIAYLKPHAQLPAVITSGTQPCSLAELGVRILAAVGLRSAAPHSTPDSGDSSLSSGNLIDHLIAQPISSEALTSEPPSAMESPKLVQSEQALPIPWESWDMKQVMNQQAMPYLNHDQAAGVHPDVSVGHQQLNQGYSILPGEWYEVQILEQRYGHTRMLVWQARAQRRNAPIERITPAYYEACAKRDAIESQPRIVSPTYPDQHYQATQSHPETLLNLENPDILEEQSAIQSNHLPTGCLAQQLRALGIRSLAGLGHLDMALVDLWVAASTHPDWQHLWDDPGGAARALLLRGELPPTPQAIERRVARSQATKPTDWAAIAAASDGYARLGDDLRDLPVESLILTMVPAREYNSCQDADRSSEEAFDIAEDIRMALRLHAVTRPVFQAVERIQVNQRDSLLVIQAGQPSDVALLRPLASVLGKTIAGRQIVWLP